MRDRKDEDREPSSEAAERYAQLPKCTRDWLEELRPDDISEINDARRFYRAARTNGKFMAWLLGGMLAMLIGGVTFGDQVIRIIAWFKR